MVARLSGQWSSAFLLKRRQHRTRYNAGRCVEICFLSFCVDDQLIGSALVAISEVTPPQTRLILGWVGRYMYIISVCNQSPGSTQLFIPLKGR